MTESGIVPESEIEGRMAARFCRQSVLEQWNPPSWLAFIDELALHRLVGGREVMRRQLDYLLEFARRKHITIRIVANHGSHAAIDGSFELIEQPGRPPVVFVEEVASQLFIEHRDEVGVYERIVERLSECALDEPQSAVRVADTARRLDVEEGAG